MSVRYRRAPQASSRCDGLISFWYPFRRNQLPHCNIVPAAMRNLCKNRGCAQPLKLGGSLGRVSRFLLGGLWHPRNEQHLQVTTQRTSLWQQHHVRKMTLHPARCAVYRPYAPLRRQPIIRCRASFGARRIASVGRDHRRQGQQQWQAMRAWTSAHLEPAIGATSNAISLN
jgi:hypothetical protein